MYVSLASLFWPWHKKEKHSPVESNASTKTNYSNKYFTSRHSLQGPPDHDRECPDFFAAHCNRILRYMNVREICASSNLRDGMHFRSRSGHTRSRSGQTRSRSGTPDHDRECPDQRRPNSNDPI